jgi:hypothetical protein
MALRVFSSLAEIVIRIILQPGGVPDWSIHFTVHR